MKYFLTPTRPHSVSVTMGMINRGVYEVKPVFAYDLYKDAIKTERNELTDENVKEAFKTGKTVWIENFYRLWGEDLNDKALFKLRLTGELENETVPNVPGINK